MIDFSPLYVGLLEWFFVLFSGFWVVYYLVDLVSFFTSDDNEQDQEKGEHK